MNDLIEALQIFTKYVGDDRNVSCEHDVMYIQCNPETVASEDIERLEELGFYADTDDLMNFYSYRFGSC